MKTKICLTSLFIFSVNIFSAELVPLTKYMETADSNDYFTLETIAKRCSAMNLAMTRWAKEGDELFKTATANYTIWFLFANQARGLKYPDDDPSIYGKNITSSIISIMEEVDALFKRNQDMSGSIFVGTFLETDFQVCSMMREKLLGNESDQ
jgi:hypothetical protein